VLTDVAVASRPPCFEPRLERRVLRPGGQSYVH
jgi:hypothetical protein